MQDDGGNRNGKDAGEIEVKLIKKILFVLIAGSIAWVYRLITGRDAPWQ